MALWPLRCAACQWPVRRTSRFRHRVITLRRRKLASIRGRLPAQRVSVGCGTVMRGIRNTTTKLVTFAVRRRRLPRLLPTNGQVSWPQAKSGGGDKLAIELDPVERDQGGTWKAPRAYAPSCRASACRWSCAALISPGQPARGFFLIGPVSSHSNLMAYSPPADARSAGTRRRFLSGSACRWHARTYR